MSIIFSSKLKSALTSIYLMDNLSLNNSNFLRSIMIVLVILILSKTTSIKVRFSSFNFKKLSIFKVVFNDLNKFGLPGDSVLRY
jgi:hypothetical protein